MQCNECKWFVGNVNDHYGICKRYPANQNKPKNDFCGEFHPKVDQISEEIVQLRRGRKPKNVD